MNKTLILTALTGLKDELFDPIVVFNNCDYIAFTDRKYNVNVWEQRPINEFSNIDNFTDRRNAKIIKILSTILFPEYEYIIWVDANRHLIVEPDKIFKEFNYDFDILLFRHGGRKCAYQEMTHICNVGNLETTDILFKQAEYYFKQGLPANWGLFEMPTFIVKNTPIIKKLQMMWWEQICKFSSRDQTSLPFVMWKLGDKLNYKFLKGNANFRNEINNRYFFKQANHLK